jgi:hypothetical protein
VQGTSEGLGGTGPPPLWLEPTVVDIFVGCSKVLAMVGRV